MYRAFIALYLLCTTSSLLAQIEPTIIRYPATSADLGIDARASYFLTLLQETLDVTEAEFGPYQLQPSPQYIPQGRAVLELRENKQLDVLWTMTSIRRENAIWPIRIPLKKGLLGVRVLAVHKDKQAQFESASSAQEIKAMHAIQGHDWPDYNILESAGFYVTPTSRYKDIYEVLTKSRFDYFPRGILEAWAEIDQYKINNIDVVKNVAIVYRAPIYFFVNKQNAVLHERINKGLQQLQASGRFDELLYQFPWHKKALDMLKHPPKLVIPLDNPLLPSETPIDQPALWDDTFFGQQTAPTANKQRTFSGT